MCSERKWFASFEQQTGVARVTLEMKNRSIRRGKGISAYSKSLRAMMHFVNFRNNDGLDVAHLSAPNS
jgi:hypothetical protein